MIRSICLNPVIDRMYYIDRFEAAKQYKEIKPQIYVGGKGVNIARVASLLGERCVLYGFVGGSGGRRIKDEMAQYEVAFRAFETDGETRTTVNIIDSAGRRETEITEPSVEVSLEQEESFLAALSADLQPGDMVICSGIPMNGMRPGIYRRISALCETVKAACVLDTNNSYLRESFPGQYYFMKPNFAELQELHGGTGKATSETICALGERTRKMGVENLLVSTGRSGGIFISSQGVLSAQVPDEPVKSTIGSGDSTVAGFCVAAKQGWEVADCVRYAMACGVCNAMFSQVGYVERDRVEELFGKIRLTAL